MNHNRITLSLVLAASLFLAHVAFGGKVYKWVDERGVVHFSDRQPDAPEKVKGPLEEREVKESLPIETKQDSEIKPLARSPIEYAANCTFTIKGSKKTGTGFFITSTGYAVTCKHVIEEGWSHTARLNDKSEVPLNIITTSLFYDLALVQVITPQATPYLQLRDAETLVPGERLFAVGASAGLQATVTDGVFTGFRQIPATKNRVIQFSAPVNPGNSGGPLIDNDGKVVGVVSLKYFMRKGVPVSGVGFAVPVEHLREEYGIYLE